MKLIHYIPTVEKPHPVPILIVYALVNRYYILDLQPDKSMIKKLLDEGFDVYVIDWGYPSGVDRYLTLDDYVNGYINNAVDKIRERSRLDKITLLGVCQGGTFSVMYAALHPEKVKNLVTLVAPVDFDTEKWIFDSPDQAGETFRQFMKDCYQKNLLIKNEMKLNGKKINLKNITMPLLNVMAEFDHLVPTDASKPLTEAVSSSDKETLVFPTGHIGIFVGSKSQKEVCPKIAAWLKPRSLLDGTGEEKPESAKEKKIEQKRKNRRSKVNKK